jgi:hemoglobin
VGDVSNHDGRPSIYDVAGGAPAFARLAAAHHARCLADPVLNHPFSHGVDPAHVEHLAQYLGEVFGGPPSYSSSVGGQSALVVIHAGNDAETELGTRFVECFVAAMDDAGLPDDAALRAAMRSYIGWAVGEFMSYAPAGSTVPDDLVVPRWTWDDAARA